MKERTPCSEDENEPSSGDERSVKMEALLRSEMLEVIESGAGIGCDGIGRVCGVVVGENRRQ